MAQDYTALDQKIEHILNEASRMMLATSVDGNSSAASVFFARDGQDLLFFTFNPTRKAEQITVNPKVQAVIWPNGQEGIRGLQVEGLCHKIKDKAEAEKARELILQKTTAFQEFMDDEFLKKNKVVGYYRIKPTTVKFVDFYADEKFEWREYAENRIPVLKEFSQAFKSRLGLWLRAVRAPFFTGTIIPVLLGAVIAYHDLIVADATNLWSWPMFWMVLIGAILAHAGTNMGNDYFDHTSRNDEYNKLFSPFNGGSRMIQAGLMPAWKVLFATLICFGGTLYLGLELNRMISGSYFGSSPLLWIGFFGIALGVFYTWNPIRLGYRGWGELSIALGFGPVMVLGSHYVLTARYIDKNIALWDWQMPLLASIPIAILIMLVVWINQFQDLPADKKVGKNTWVVRLADYKGSFVGYEKPFQYYMYFNFLSFAFIFALGFVGFVKPELATPFVLISLLPLVLLRFAIKWGKEWLTRWNEPDADRQKLPYELLKVNVSTIGIHFFTGVLLVLGYWLQTVF
jgi:1,4-dihydroxy-2-naphthoate octaprenyltransferase/nitroimidazol reductase NimA-like FMN-containing flavoprotein (pyridoxamine 5'-phosphate oxidase superfamily)